MNWLIEWDKELFVVLNSMGTENWDPTMVWMTRKTSWFPFYGLIISFIFIKFKKERWLIFVAIALLITITEQLASGLFKPWFERLRPCNDPSLNSFIRIVDGCGNSFSFFSAHAANTFGLATFIWLLLRNQGHLKWIGIIMIVWAAFVSYSRVYLGVHFPLDIFCGALCGILSALAIYRIYTFSCSKVLQKS